MYLKDGINRQGEDFYYMSTLIEVVAEDPDTLEQRVSAMETLCTSLDIVCRRCDYRQEQAFLSSLPLLALDGDIERKARRNALTTGVAAAFPFSSFEICDQSGIMLGINLHNRSVCMIDIFDATKYANANVQVFIIAPLKGFEFRPACETIGGRYIKILPPSDDCVNIMEIRRATSAWPFRAHRRNMARSRRRGLIWRGGCRRKVIIRKFQTALFKAFSLDCAQI